MILQSVSTKSQKKLRPITFGFHPRKDVIVEVSDKQLSSDGGLIAIKEFDNRIGFIMRFAKLLFDKRKGKPRHTIHKMLGSRIYGFLSGYTDQNDHQQLRFDPVFKIVAGRDPNDGPLASQSSLSRFENQVTSADLLAIIEEVPKEWAERFHVRPSLVTLDVDAVDDTVHGQQQLCMFHGFYEQYQYLPLLISHAESNEFVSGWLRPGVVPASLGAEDDLERVTKAVRGKFPDVEILIRGDCGFGLPSIYRFCEENLLSYLIGIATNARLAREAKDHLALAKERFEETGEKQRIFHVFHYRAESWDRTRTVIAKSEYNAKGPNQRFVVTNRPGALINPEAIYDEYAMRGDAENRNKEIKNGLGMDRLSDCRFMANFFRMLMSMLSHNLLVRMKNCVQIPDKESDPDQVPQEALTGLDRTRFQRERRKWDPLGRAHPQTWRDKFIKVAVEVVSTSRRIVIRMAANWPYLELFKRTSQSILSFG